MNYIWISKLTIIRSDNGLPSGQRQAIIWTNAGILIIEPLGTNLNEILIKIYTFPFKKMHFKMLSWKWQDILSQPQCVKWVTNLTTYQKSEIIYSIGIHIRKKSTHNRPPGYGCWGSRPHWWHHVFYGLIFVFYDSIFHILSHWGPVTN